MLSQKGELTSLQWNLDGTQTLGFGNTVSSSNMINDKEVYVESDMDLAWISTLKV